MRRVLASLSSAVVALGLLIGVAPSAQAADLGSVTVSYDASAPSFVSFSPTSLTGGAGDTFTFVNNRYNSLSSYISIENGTGSATMGGTPCTSSTACQVLDKNPPPRSAVVTIASAGTFTIYRFTSGSPTSIGTLTVSENGSISTTLTDPALVYPTLYLNANGGTCTGTMQFTKYNGQNDLVTLPTSETCTRSGYTLLGWAQTADTNLAWWLPGDPAPIGDESFTVYAVWRADGLEVIYNANVGMSTECLKDGVNLSTSADRSVSRVITPQSEGEALAWDGGFAAARWTTAVPAPVCSPPGYEFLGWSAFPSGPAFRPSAANTSQADLLGYYSPGNSVRLYAQWGLSWGVQMTATSQQLTPGGTATLTVTALRNGSADAGAPRLLRIVDSAGAVSLFSPFTSPAALTSQFQTNSDGTLSIPIYASQTPGAGSITAAYGDASQTLEFTVASPQPPSIVITGERRTVNGRPGIQVDGTATGLPEGTKLIPWFRFPGQTDYSQSSARPTTNAEGEFSWQRKTGKKVYAIFTDEDGLVQSNRVIIPAK